MDCVTSFAGVVGSSPTEKKQKFVRFSSFIIPPISISWILCTLYNFTLQGTKSAFATHLLTEIGGRYSEN